MIEGKSILAIVPARGGSKGIGKKNIRLLAGKPLLAWTIEEAQKSKHIDRLILSSEDEEIIKIAKDYNCEVPFTRPKSIAQDNTPGIEPVLHAINTLPEKYDFVCLLQPTSPLRKASDMDNCIEKCINLEAISCVSVVETNKHPFRAFYINKYEHIEFLFPNRTPSRRQELQQVFVLNGAIYFANTDFLLQNKSFIAPNTVTYIMQKINSVDIDDEIDFRFAELLLS